MSKNDIPRLIMFCGLPGTLKTYLSKKLAEQIGHAYLPTSMFGIIEQSNSKDELTENRKKRYKQLSEISKKLSELEANVVLDGGYYSKSIREEVLKHFQPIDCVIIYCYCHDDNIKKRRLKLRSIDYNDIERQSAIDILENNILSNFESPDDNNIRIIKVNTGTYKVEDERNRDDRIVLIINELLSTYEANPIPKPFTKKIVTHFNDLSNDYNESTVWRKSKRLLDSIQVELNSNSRVLDIGAGTGLASKLYEEKNHIVVGIDTSKLMLQQAKNNLTIGVVGDAHQLPFLEEDFDLALMRQCLHYLDPKLAIKEVNRILKLKGILCLSSIVVPDLDSKILWQEFKNTTQPLRLSIFTINELKEYLIDAGFEILSIEEHKIERKLSIDNLENRVETPAQGWKTFIEHFGKLINQINPNTNFILNNENITYNQFWVSIKANKIRSFD